VRGNEVLGIIFANAGDEKLPQLTGERTTGSVPFGCRYRLIDFTLSNMVNSGVRNIGVVIKSNYRSLLEHLGNGKQWDLARKRGGLHLLAPFAFADFGLYRNRIDALFFNLSFIEKSPQKYVLISDSNMVANIDLNKMMAQHRESAADITIAYKKEIGEVGLKIAECGKVLDITDDDMQASAFGYVLIGKDLLLSLTRHAELCRKEDFYRDMIKDELLNSRVFGYEVEGYAQKIADISSYFKTNMQLLDKKIRDQLFEPSRPILTKLYDEMPSICGVDSKIENSLIADGCEIQGCVKNSILFRGVTVEKGAIVENCILMQGAEIGENARIRYVVADKKSRVTASHTMVGTKQSILFLESER
jgi:glucose-1-phosphate adenylyltransferase